MIPCQSFWLTFRELHETADLGVRRFWLKRIFRTWPLYFTLLAFCVWRAPEHDPLLGHYLTFTQNFYEMKMLIPSWSLAIEEQFYLLFPLVILLLFRFRRSTWIPALCLAGIVLAFCFRYTHPEQGRHTLACLDSLLCGILIAYLHSSHPGLLAPLRRRCLLVSFLALTMVYLPFLLPPDTAIRAMLLQGGFALGFGLLIAANTGPDTPLARPGRLVPVAFVAAISYSLYLIQDRPLFWSARIVDRLRLSGWEHTLSLLLISVASSILCATVLYHLIEKPALRARNRLLQAFSSRRSESASSSSRVASIRS